MCPEKQRGMCKKAVLRSAPRAGGAALLQRGGGGITQLSRTETEAIGRELQQHIKTIVGISTKVNVLEFEGIPRTLTGKARRVIDQRPKQL